MVMDGQGIFLDGGVRKNFRVRRVPKSEKKGEGDAT